MAFGQRKTLLAGPKTERRYAMHKLLLSLAAAGALTLAAAIPGQARASVLIQPVRPYAATYVSPVPAYSYYEPGVVVVPEVGRFAPPVVVALRPFWGPRVHHARVWYRPRVGHPWAPWRHHVCW
jgi:hypothetical protein